MTSQDEWTVKQLIREALGSFFGQTRVSRTDESGTAADTIVLDAAAAAIDGEQLGGEGGQIDRVHLGAVAVGRPTVAQVDQLRARRVALERTRRRQRAAAHLPVARRRRAL